MKSKSYEFRDIFIKSCDYANGEGNCTKTREAEKCINDKCEKVSSPAESKKEVMTDHYNQIKYDSDSDSEYDNIFDKYKGSQSGGGRGSSTSNYTQEKTVKCSLCNKKFVKEVHPLHILKHIKNRKKTSPKMKLSYILNGGSEEKETDVSVTLDINNFNKMISQNDVLVKFYAPWCGHCIHLVPEWNKLYNQNKTDTIIANFDGTKQLPKDITIEGFPTIILFKNGKQILYEGERTADNLLEFLNKNGEQSGGDRQGRRYWIKDGKKINYNPNGYQKSKLNNSRTKHGRFYVDIDMNTDTDSDNTSYSESLFDEKPKLVLKPKISPKKDELNQLILHNKKVLHSRNNDSKLKDALNHIDNLMTNLNVKHGGCDCDQTGGYNGNPKLKKRLIENLVKKYKGTCNQCGKSKNCNFLPPKKKFKFECKGDCQYGGCGPLCLAPLLMLGGTKLRRNSKRKSSPKLRRNSKHKSSPKLRQNSKRKSSPKLRLIKIVKSTKHDKKLMAVFEKNGREKTVHFGAKNYSDYTHHHDEARKKRYLDRHRKNENWNDPTSAGSLSKNLLWNKTSLRASIADYKRRFHF